MMCILSSSPSTTFPTTTTDHPPPPPPEDQAPPDNNSKSSSFEVPDPESPQSSSTSSTSSSSSSSYNGNNSDFWRRLLVKNSRGNWTVEFVSPKGLRFNSQEALTDYIRTQNIQYKELHFEAKTLPITFCNMRQNIFDMRRQRRRKERKKSTEWRKNNLLVPRKPPLPPSVSSSDTDVDFFPPEKKVNLDEFMSTISEKDEKISRIDSSKTDSTPKPIDDTAIEKVQNTEGFSSAAEEKLIPVSSEFESLVRDSIVRTPESRLPITDAGAITTTHRHQVVVPALTVEAARESKFSVVTIDETELCSKFIQENILGEVIDDVIHEVSRTVVMTTSDREEGENNESFSHSNNNNNNGSFLSSFLDTIERREEFDCRIPLVDIFSESPLSSFICYGCSRPYSSSDSFSVNFKCQILSVDCSHCFWWTTRRITTKKVKSTFDDL